MHTMWIVAGSYREAVDGIGWHSVER